MKILSRSIAVVVSCLIITTSLTAMSNEYCLRANDVGQIYLTFAGKHGGNLTKKELNEHSSIFVVGCSREAEIYTYELEITKNKKRMVYKSDSGKLNKSILDQLRSLNAGDEFTFKDIKAYLPNGKSVEVWGKKFTVVSEVGHIKS